MFFPFLLTINFLANFFLPEHPNVSYADRPSWVKDISAAENCAVDSSQKEMQYLLVDHQCNLETSEEYVHTVHKVLEGGIENASTISIEFDPSYESIILNKLTVYRNGQEIETALQNKAHLIQREVDLERHIYNGVLSLIFMLSDLRSDDIVEVAYIRKGQNPIFDNHFTDITYLSFSEKIEKFHYRVVRPKSILLHFKIYNAPFSFEEAAIDDAYLETVLLLSPTEVKELYDTPYWHFPIQWFQVTDYNSWQEVSEWGKKLFYLDSTSHVSEVKELVEGWKKKYKEKEELVLTALNFVQNEIRYLGLESGIYSHLPRSPKETFMRRHGDCKDKTLLLKLFMDEIGVDSTPCVVNTRFLDLVQNWLPSHALFNHAILKVTLNGEDYWLDPTERYQRGSIEEQSQTFYGCYLLFNGEEDSLVKFPPVRKKQVVEVSYDYRVVPNQSELKIKTIFTGDKANFFRAQLAYEGKVGIEKKYTEFFSTLFGSAELKEKIHIVDSEANEITVVKNFTLKDLLKNEGKFHLPSGLLDTYLPEKVPLGRKDPVELDHPLEIRETVRISSDQFHDMPKQKKSFDHPAFAFNYEYFKDGSDIILKYFYQTKTDHILPEDFSSLRSIISNIHNDVLNVYTYNAERHLSEVEKWYRLTYISIFSILALFAIWQKIKAYKRRKTQVTPI